MLKRRRMLVFPTKAAVGGGGGGTPAWVPAGALYHIDFMFTGGRAWNGTAEVGIGTILGNDPVVDTGWGPSSYNASSITVDGYDASLDASPCFAFIGAARTKLLAGATLKAITKVKALVAAGNVAMMSADGTAGIQFAAEAGSRTIKVSSWGGAAIDQSAAILTSTVGQINKAACTITATRFEGGANGNADTVAVTLLDADRPAAKPFVAVSIDYANFAYFQSITIFEPLASVSGLPGITV